ncbi:hypothetical protein BDR22DRAFT_856065 [Usnea florida]
MTTNSSLLEGQEKAAYKPNLNAFDTIVQIKVGPQKRLFNMHKRLLCNTSAFFEAALNGNFKESKTQTIEMAEDDADVFHCFQYWAYTGVIDREPRDHSEISWRTLIDLYIFAEVRCIPALQNSAMNVLIRKHESSPRAPIEEYRYIYENTAKSSPLRKFLAMWAAHRGLLSEDWFFDRTIFPLDFVIDLSLALHERIRSKTAFYSGDFSRMRSEFHVDEAVASWGEGSSN